MNFLPGKSYSERECILSVRGISKFFGSITALKGVDLDVRREEIHVLLGENGAGKTTLVNILYGIYRPDSGVIKVFGRDVKIGSPKDAISYGIVLVQQHPMLIDKMTVAENLSIGFRKLGYLKSPKSIKNLVDEYSSKYGITVDADALVSDLSFSEKQEVELIRALMLDAKLLILDEPTTMLTTYERKKLFSILRKLIEEGRSVLLITHKVIEALEISDWITVLRRGEVIASRPRNAYMVDELVKLVVGESENVGQLRHSELNTASNIRQRPEVLSIKELVVANDVGGIAVRGISLNVNPGEVVGIAGVSGNGQKELSEALAGLRRVRSGKIFICGLDLTNKGPGERVKAGLAYIPEERLKYGIVGEMSVAENFILKSYNSFSKYGFIVMNKVLRDVEEAIQTFNIVTRGPLEKVKALSGGNIQKLIVARELRSNPKVVVAHNPTLGLDLRSAALVRELILKVKLNNSGVLLISEDLDEVIGLSDRVAVMYRGSIVYEADKTTISRNTLERAMLGLVDV
ncbi:MAG: ABC transporter ATP-binding protein [Sulfolobales archaeon]